MCRNVVYSPLLSHDGQCEPHPPVLTSDARGVTTDQSEAGTEAVDQWEPEPGAWTRPHTEARDSRETEDRGSQWQTPASALSWSEGTCHQNIDMMLHLTFKSVKHE